MPSVLVPSCSSAFSAYGCLAADLRYDAVRTHRIAIEDAAVPAWERTYSEMERGLVAQLERERVPATEVVLRRSMDLRYRGQNYEIEVPVAAGDDGRTLRGRFGEIHGRLYEYTTDEPVEGVNLRVAAIVPTPLPGFPAAAVAVPDSGGTAPAGARRTYHTGRGWVPTPVHQRSSLPPGRRILGPAIAQDSWSTIVVPPGQCCRADAHGHLWIEPVS